VHTLSYTAGVQFDVLATGSRVNTGWVSSSDGLLVLDRNHDGQITDGSELFGTATQLANGSKAPNGYAALREFDSDGDGAIDSQDSIYADLRVWVDTNADGTSQAGEIKTLAGAGVASIGLQDSAILSKDNGNLIGLTSTYQATDGSTHAAADVWFVADKRSSAATPVKPATSVGSVTPVDSAIAALHVTAAPQAAPQPDIRASVSGLAQAIGSFESIAAAAREMRAPVPDGRTPTQSAATLTVASMVDVMKGFDNNGNSVFATSSGAAALGKSITLPNLQDPSKNGILVNPAG
jgi:hypothetical protein